MDSSTLRSTTHYQGSFCSAGAIAPSGELLHGGHVRLSGRPMGGIAPISSKAGNQELEALKGWFNPDRWTMSGRCRFNLAPN